MYEIHHSEKDGYIITSFPVGDFASNAVIVYKKDSKECIIFDPGFHHEPVLDFIKANSLTAKKIIHTHGHFDHIAASPEIKRQTGATLHLHKNDLHLYTSMPEHASMFGLVINTKIEKIDDVFSEGVEYGFGNNHDGPVFKCIHTPGHSLGSCSFYTEFFQKPLVICGDTLFQGSIGRTDLPDGDFNTIIESIKKKLFTLPDETDVITGHGPTTSISQEKLHNPFVK
ncbi:MAG: MBL fold metallo-hydrolase [Bacteriovoracaceae bacterium]|nr:MBL fold metallo-hydrolase [Bacteriovoracaceae bacterium]